MNKNKSLLRKACLCSMTFSRGCCLFVKCASLVPVSHVPCHIYLCCIALVCHCPSLVVQASARGSSPHLPSRTITLPVCCCLSLLSGYPCTYFLKYNHNEPKAGSSLLSLINVQLVELFVDES